MVRLEPTMFREYDIRGRINEEELNEHSFAAIIRGYGRFLRKRGIDRVVVGYDNRSHSEAFSEIATGILGRAGFAVYDVGLSLSPAVYFAQYALDCPGGVMITASHNPNGWGGVKLAMGFSQTLGSKEIKEVYALASEESKASLDRKGSVKQVDIRSPYLGEILKRIGPLPKHDIRLLVDAANGGAGLFVYELFQELGCRTFQLNCDPDYSYPHYFPNPSAPEARRRIKDLVAHPYIKADLALAFDGDGDRLGVVDGGGRDIWSDRILMIFAAEVLQTRPQAPIIYDVKATRALSEAVASLGGQGVMCPTGHSYVKAKLQQLSSPLAGERSGHIFFGAPFYYGFDDALFAGAFLVAVMAKEGKNIEELLSPYPHYCTTEEIAIPCGDKEKYQVVEKVKSILAAQWGEEHLNTINGVRLELPEGWALLRGSSNLPELVLVAEGEDRAAMDRMSGIIYKALASASLL
ncbi:MAG: phosphomannomutase/phosphoglucomutase [Bacillota bacterium]|nr:phosphomannomutase/phosphoglucomutase [Bacillota bacterium]